MSLKDKKFADVYFCGDEDDGHAKKNKWFKTWRPSEYDAEDDDNDQYWYSIDKNGKLASSSKFLQITLVQTADLRLVCTTSVETMMVP